MLGLPPGGLPSAAGEGGEKDQSQVRLLLLAKNPDMQNGNKPYLLP